MILTGSVTSLDEHLCALTIASSGEGEAEAMVPPERRGAQTRKTQRGPLMDEESQKELTIMLGWKCTASSQGSVSDKNS